MQKSPDAFRTISEVAEELDLPQHVLRFWETRFSTIRPLKRGGGRRYYRPDDIDLLKGIRHLLYGQGYTIKGVQRILREQGLRSVQALGRGEQPALPVTHEPSDDEEEAGQESHDAIEDAIDDAAAPAPEYTDDRSGAGSLRHDEVPYRLPGAIRPESDLNRTGPGSGAGLAGDDIVHLRGVLDELLECERILGSLQAE